MADTGWRERAECQGVGDGDHGIDFTDESDANVRKIKREYCGHCPVAGECLQYAFDTATWFGVWGGMTTSERRKIQRQRRRAAG